MQHLSTIGQQQFKTKRVKDVLQRIGHCDVDVNDCIMMDNPWYYRNKVQVPVGLENNEVITGFYKNHTNDIISMDQCFIQNEESNLIVNRVKELMNEYHIEPYNKVTKQGNIKHILTKQGYYTQEMMVVLISNYKKIPHIFKIVNRLKKEFPHIKTIIQNINPRDDNVILGDKENILYGEGYIEDTLLGLTYRISLKSFYQVNPIQVEKLYLKAIEYADLNKDDIVLDAYCGIGTIGLSLANQVKKVYGVEIVEQAIENAKENALRNHIDNVEFYAEDAGEFMVKSQHNDINVVMVDPPRKGCSKIFLDQLLKLSPEKIVYISCDVSTQARDIAYLQENGYIVDKCQPVDMFPQTTHIENIVRMLKADK
jgi:23S rRNA (uracil1939-C5)-methyltransferase